MPSAPTDLQPSSWHRFFAIECNNRAWDLAARQRTDQENLELLNAAHAAAWHWSIVGVELNQMRAKMLLARVHALLGWGSSALSLAAEVRNYFVERETTPSELAFAHAIYAHAALVAGDRAEYASAYEAALRASEQIALQQERDLFRETFDLIPAP